MKNLNVKIVCSVFYLLIYQTSIAENWQSYQIQEGNFKIFLPVKSSIRPHYLIGTSEDITYTLWYSSPDPQQNLTLAGRTLRAKLDALVKKLQKNHIVTIEKSKDIQIQLFPGKEVRIRLESKSSQQVYTILYRNLMTPQYIYEFQIRRAHDFIAYEKSSKFLNSFEFLNEFPKVVWKPYQFNAGNFSISLPKTPQLLSQQVKLRSEGINYQIDYQINQKGYDLSRAEKLVKIRTEKLLKSIQRQNEKIKVERIVPTKMLNLPAMEIHVQKTEGAIPIYTVYRILYTKNHSYLFEIEQAYQYIDYERAGQFFRSFYLMK